MTGKRSPFAPARLADMPAIAGVRLAACEAGIHYRGRKDLMLALLDPGTSVAGVLTDSKCASAPVDWCRTQLGRGKARALVVNSGNANAFTGLRGDAAVRQTAEIAARIAGAAPEDVLLASTGVIGDPLDVSDFAEHLGALAGAARPDGWREAAEAIMTTDTYPKLATARARLGDCDVIVNGIAKGSGMIAPNLIPPDAGATMLAFLFTDAPLEAPVLSDLLNAGMSESFNAITVDGDTSTSDTVLLFATGGAGKFGAAEITDPADPHLAAFSQALHDLMRDLALQIVKDGEGLGKFVTVRVEGAESPKAARRIAFSIANSPLVKTAIAGEDPNWGRVVMAVGKAGEAADRDRLAIWFGDVLVAEKGEVASGYVEADAARHMREREIVIRVDVGVGTASSRVWTCDLTHDYISINADYRS